MNRRLHFQNTDLNFRPMGEIRELPDTPNTLRYLTKLSHAAPLRVWVFESERDWVLLEAGVILEASIPSTIRFAEGIRN
jgi:hypothetical protein